MSSLSYPMPHAEGSGPPVGPMPIPWDRFKREVLALYAPPMRSPATLSGMRQILDLVAGLGVSSTAGLTPELVARFIAARPVGESPNTTYALVARLRVLCNYAAGRGYLYVSPFALRKRWVRKVRRGARRHHSREEIARVLNLMRGEIERKRGWAQWRARRLHALAATVAYTGLRRTEALYLRVEDIDLEARMLLIHPGRHRLKTEDSAQPVPIPDALLPILSEWLPHLALPDPPPASTCDPGWVFPNTLRTGPWTGGSPAHQPLSRLKAAGKRAGVEGFTFQSLRHSFATHAEFWGLSDAMIQRILRHTTTRTQWYYRHPDLDNMRAQVNGIGFGHDLADVEAASGGADMAAIRPPMPPPGPPVGPATQAIDRGPKLDDEDVAEMRELRGRGWTYKALCARYRVSKSTVHSTLHHAIHREVPPAGGEGGKCG